jgi:uncharacterized glyoxalase superfamily protein PhnB
MNTTARTTQQCIYPALRYQNAKAAIGWLKSALGFTEREVCAGEGDSIAHAELELGGNLIMLGSGATGAIYIGLESSAAVDAAYVRAKSAGAEIIRELEDTEYQSHEFSVRDPEGHRWSFGTYRPQAG